MWGEKGEGGGCIYGVGVVWWNRGGFRRLVGSVIWWGQRVNTLHLKQKNLETPTSLSFSPLSPLPPPHIPISISIAPLSPFSKSPSRDAHCYKNAFPTPRRDVPITVPRMSKVLDACISRGIREGWVSKEGREGREGQWRLIIEDRERGGRTGKSRRIGYGYGYGYRGLGR